MSKSIKLVRGDTGPQIKIILSDEETDEVISLVGAQLVMYFRAAGSTALLASLPGFVLNGAAGVAIFEWGPNTLNIPQGAYQGEIEITFANGMRQSVYRTLSFVVREQFA